MSDYQRAYQREKLARLQAEKLLEDKSREVYQARLAIEAQYQTVLWQKSELEFLNKVAVFTVSLPLVLPGAVTVSAA